MQPSDGEVGKMKKGKRKIYDSIPDICFDRTNRKFLRYRKP